MELSENNKNFHGFCLFAMGYRAKAKTWDLWNFY